MVYVTEQFHQQSLDEISLVLFSSEPPCSFRPIPDRAPLASRLREKNIFARFRHLMQPAGQE